MEYVVSINGGPSCSYENITTVAGLIAAVAQELEQFVQENGIGVVPNSITVEMA